MAEGGDGVDPKQKDTVSSRLGHFTFTQRVIVSSFTPTTLRVLQKKERSSDLPTVSRALSLRVRVFPFRYVVTEIPRAITAVS